MRVNPRRLAEQLANLGWLPVPLVEGRCYPKNNWWRPYAEAGDAGSLIADDALPRPAPTRA